jgi:hypothetical protein
MKVGDLVMKRGGIHDGVIAVVLVKESPSALATQRAGDMLIVMSHENPARRLLFFEEGCEVINEGR